MKNVKLIYEMFEECEEIISQTKEALDNEELEEAETLIEELSNYVEKIKENNTKKPLLNGFLLSR